MKLSIKHLALAACLLSPALVSSAAVPLGGADTLCDGTLWRWNVSQSNPISWRIARDQGFPRTVIPGFPGLGCNSGGAQRPGVQSMVRAAKTWQFANYPGLPVHPLGSNFSGFALDIPHTSFIKQNTGGGVSLFGFQDGNNVLTFLEPAANMTLYGDPLAISSVWLDGAGTIQEADIAFNATAVDGGGQPLYVFVEENNYTSTSYISSPVAPATPFYWDLEGVITHEFGHFAGLSHSLVGGEYNGATSTQPTMFPFAQGQLYTQTTQNHAGGACASTSTVQLNGVRLLARSSRTLEMDDLAALGKSYPLGMYQNQLGTIAGVVQDSLGLVDTGGHVTAISTSDPAGTRIGGILHTDGTYSIQGVPPGTYHLAIEPVETSRAQIGNLNGIPDPTGTTWFFTPRFGDGDVPYLYQQGVGGVPWDPTTTPCISGNGWRLTIPELFDQWEDPVYFARNCEYSPSQSSTLTVSAGNTTTADWSQALGNIPGIPGTGECCLPHCQGANIPRQSPIPLWVGIKTPGAAGALSSQGLAYGTGSAAFTLAFLAAGPLADDSGGTWATGNVTLRLSPTLATTLRGDGQVELINYAGAVTRTGVLDNNSMATFDFGPGAFPPAGLPSNLVTVFAQAELFNPGFNSSMLSNVVAVTVIQ